MITGFHWFSHGPGSKEIYWWPCHPPETQLCIPNCDGSHHRRLAPFAPSTAYARLPVATVFLQVGLEAKHSKTCLLHPNLSTRLIACSRQRKRNHGTFWGWQSHRIRIKQVLTTKLKKRADQIIYPTIVLHLKWGSCIMLYLDFPMPSMWKNMNDVTRHQSCTKSWGHGHSKQCQWHRAMYRRCEPWEAMVLPEADLKVP